MSNNNRVKKSRFGKGLLVGAALGAAAAALLTPKTGKEAQKILRKAIATVKVRGRKAAPKIKNATLRVQSAISRLRKPSS